MVRCQDLGPRPGGRPAALPQTASGYLLWVMTSPQNPGTPHWACQRFPTASLSSTDILSPSGSTRRGQFWALLMEKGQCTITCLLSQRGCRDILWTIGPLKTSSMCRTQNYLGSLPRRLAHGTERRTPTSCYFLLNAGA